MFIEQLRCDDDVSELFQKERVFGPTESTMNSGLWMNIVSTRIDSDDFLWLTEQVLWMWATVPFARGDSRLSMGKGFSRNFGCWVGRPCGANDIVSACGVGSLTVFVEAHSSFFSPSPLSALAIEPGEQSE